jgi:hypothetical protein
VFAATEPKDNAFELKEKLGAYLAVPVSVNASALRADETVTVLESATVSAGTYVKIKWHTAPEEIIVLQSPDLVMFDGKEPKFSGATALPSLEIVKVCAAVWPTITSP